MGVSRTDYIIYGWKLPYDLKDKNGVGIDTYDDKFLPFIEGHKGVEYSLINDGMSGEYKVFGKCIKYADEYDGWEFINLDINNLDAMEVKTKFKEIFDIDVTEEPKLFIFSHYS